MIIRYGTSSAFGVNSTGNGWVRFFTLYYFLNPPDDTTTKMSGPKKVLFYEVLNLKK